ncbi:hypothetical protein PG991_013266 [Apiospora marii]|uniref:Uncharacterized protein n=1 Tax=Apiospora marii TaxID=335849 RepID=A0ABR1R5I9_9PEZI
MCCSLDCTSLIFTDVDDEQVPGAASGALHHHRHHGDGRAHPWVPRETGLVAPAPAAAAPAPVPAPEVAVAPVAASAAPVLAAAAAAATTTTITITNTWVNARTCGWVSGVSSSPIGCEGNYHCATNAAHAVGCASGTFSPLFSQRSRPARLWNVPLDRGAGTVHVPVPPDRHGVDAAGRAPVRPGFSDEHQHQQHQHQQHQHQQQYLGGVAASPTATPSSSDDDDEEDDADREKNTITVAVITIGTILGFFLVLGLVRLAAGFSWRCCGGDGGGVHGGESVIELVDLPQQQQQQEGRQV